MSTTLSEQALQTLAVVKDELIQAPIEVVFETILEQMGPYNETPDGTPLRMKLEAWPGGRWFRDFGDNTGHLWGHVQSFKPPTLLEIHGPLFMSSPAVSHVLYRLIEEGKSTRLKFSHRAIGEIAPEYQAGVDAGWGKFISKIRAASEGKSQEKNA